MNGARDGSKEALYSHTDNNVFILTNSLFLSYQRKGQLSKKAENMKTRSFYTVWVMVTMFIVARARRCSKKGIINCEVHDDVDNALSDASTQWPIDKLEDILKSIISFRETYLKHG